MSSRFPDLNKINNILREEYDIDVNKQDLEGIIRNKEEIDRDMLDELKEESAKYKLPDDHESLQTLILNLGYAPDGNYDDEERWLVLLTKHAYLKYLKEKRIIEDYKINRREDDKDEMPPQEIATIDFYPERVAGYIEEKIEEIKSVSLDRDAHILLVNNKTPITFIELTKKKEAEITKTSASASLKSIHLVTNSLQPQGAIFLVLDKHFETPIRCIVQNKRTGELTYIAKLYNIAYFVDAPGKKVEYDKRLADNINNGLFRKRRVAEYMRTNKLEKPTLVQKSEEGTLVLKNEILIKTGRVKNDVPSQYQYLYIDKTM